MNENHDLKLTDLDYLIGNHHIQMVKAALPYMNLSEQKILSVLVKFSELQKTISLFEDEEVASMGICSLDTPKTPVDMLQAIKPYGNTAEQDIIEFLCSFLGTGQMSEPISTMSGESEPSARNRRSPLEQLKGFFISRTAVPHGDNADADANHAATYIISPKRQHYRKDFLFYE